MRTLGNFERDVLLAIHRQGDKAYAVSIKQDIDAQTGKDTNLGAIYVTTDRLEKKGYVTSRLGDPTPERGGKPKRMYRIAAPGITALNVAAEADRRRALNSGWQGLPA
jgi:PadR family transcriptional regulator, regulatory protein PadR